MWTFSAVTATQRNGVILLLESKEEKMTWTVGLTKIERLD
jgi:hypothetical protein